MHIISAYKSHDAYMPFLYHARITKPNRRGRLLGDDSASLRDVDTVQELSDILVSDWASTVDRSSRLRDVANIITLDDQLVLLVL